VVFLDLKKVFNTVDHEILLLKLHNIGIRRIPHNLLKSYLENQTCCPKVWKTKSKKN